LTYRLGNIQDALNQVHGPIVMTVTVVVIANIVFAILLSRVVISPIKMLNTVTKEVAAGDLDLKVKIKTGDELQELGDTFNYMTVELKKMKERAENANPLTKLPGNIVIMEEVDKRIRDNSPFVVIYSDLNNFKAFNDKYGIHEGDEAIKMTADIMRKAVRERGNPNDLLGHEGGDDFVIVTTPEKADEIARAIVEKFDADVKALYHTEDLAQGFFVAKDRDGNIRKFPIMGIALSGVTNKHRPLNSYGEVTNICAEVKKKVKAQGSSAWYLDQRTATV
jgi:diguanylate cyclase (GGDEF)-like protein